MAFEAMQCQSCGRIKKFSFTERPHFWCYVCEPRVVEQNIGRTIVLWLALIGVIIGAWMLVG